MMKLYRKREHGARRLKMKMLVNSMYDKSAFAERSLQAGGLGYVSQQAARETLIDAIRTLPEGETYLSVHTIDTYCEKLKIKLKFANGAELNRYATL